MTFSETFLVFLVILVVFLGVKFGFRKSCLCKRNDKYKVPYPPPLLNGKYFCNFSLAEKVDPLPPLRKKKSVKYFLMGPLGKLLNA